MADSGLLNAAQHLGDAEKMEMISVLWDSIDHSKREPPEDVLSTVRERAKDADIHPQDQMTSEEFWARIERRDSIAYLRRVE
ncbi:hypothetical protein [Ancrocorticia populi]|nr:hypothetical protein [Ancrocorticia populi]